MASDKQEFNFTFKCLGMNSWTVLILTYITNRQIFTNTLAFDSVTTGTFREEFLKQKMD